jgi:hypothetical protein
MPEKTAVEMTLMPEETVVSSQEYDQLEKLLEQKDWKQADKRTSELMLKAAGREKADYLDINSINTFSCPDLRTIDRLWVKYSDGRFGFSVQKRIWERVGGKPGVYDEEIHQTFGDRVGWRVKGEWQGSGLSFSLNAQPGHLPAGLPILGGGVVFAEALLSRVETCKV